MNRKTFLRSLSGATGGALLLDLILREDLRAASSPAPWPEDGADSGEFWKFLRDQFPLTRERAYLNTGGLGASPYVVIDAVKEKMDELEKISETGHDPSLWAEMKATAGLFLGCDADELAFTRNTTEGVNIVANGLPLGRGDEMITSTHEHVGNALTWLALAKRTGMVIKMFEPSTVSQQENLDRIGALVTRKTRLISLPHVVTTTGLIMPVKEIAAMARNKKIWFFIDGAQSAGMIPFNLHEIGCDAYATSGHKWLLGPKETGLLYVRKDMLDTIEAKAIGAYSDGGFDWLKQSYKLNPSAQRYEYATVSTPLRVGLWTAIQFIQRIGIEKVWGRDQALSGSLAQGLRKIPGVTVLSPEREDMRGAMITLKHDAVTYEQLQEHLDTYHLRTRVVTEAGLDALRISTHVYNTPEEVDRVLEAVKTVKRA